MMLLSILALTRWWHIQFAALPIYLFKCPT